MGSHRQVAKAYVTAIAVLAVGLLLAACSSSSSDSSGSYTLNGKNMTLAFGPAAATKLIAQGVAASPIAPATNDPNGGVVFPITSGTLKKSNLQGTIKFSGGLTFTAPGNKSLSFSDLSLDTTGGLLSAKVEGNVVTVLQLNPLKAALAADKQSVVITGTAATLFTAFAATVNQALGVTGFGPNTPIGSVIIEATFANP